MNKFNILLKFRLKYPTGTYKDNPFAKFTPRHYIAAAAVGLVFLLLLIPYTFIIYLMYKGASQTGSPEVFLDALLGTSALMLLLSSVLVSYNSIFTGNNDQMLLTMPFTPRQLFCSSFFISGISAYMSMLILFVPGIGIWFYFQGFTPGVLAGSIVTVLCLPLIILSISYLVVMGIISLFKGFKYKEVLITIAVIIGIILMILGNGLDFGAEGSVTSDLFKDLFSHGEERAFSLFPVGWVKCLVFVFAAFIFAAGGVIFYPSIYMKLVRKISSSSGQGNKKKIDYKKHSQQKAIFQKERRDIFRSWVYTVNALPGLILSPLLGLILSFMPDFGGEASIFGFIVNMLEKRSNVSYAFLLAGALVIMSTLSVASTTYSREGKCNWIARIIPVPGKKQSQGRMILPVILYFLCGIQFIVILSIAFKLDFLYTILCMSICMLMSFSFTYIGMYIDIKHPKVFWELEKEAVKQNVNVIFSIICCLVMALIIGIVAYLNLILAVIFSGISVFITRKIFYKEMILKG